MKGHLKNQIDLTIFPLDYKYRAAIDIFVFQMRPLNLSIIGFVKFLHRSTLPSPKAAHFQFYCMMMLGISASLLAADNLYPKACSL